MAARNTKEALIEAAIRMFKEKGIDQVGVRDISSAAGVTTGSFYHHFSSKDDVLHGIYEGRDIQFGKRLAQLLEEGEKTGYCDRILEFFVTDMSEIVEQDGRDFTEHRMLRMRLHSREDTRLIIGLKELVEKAKENGEFLKKYDTELINHYLFMVFRGILYDWCIGSTRNGNEPLADIMQRGMSAAIRGFQI